MKYAILGIVSIAFISCAQIKELEATVDTLKGDLAKVQVDNDGDGVSDAFDMESNTPKGALVDGSGRALDLDGDGVRHELDTCLLYTSPSPRDVEESRMPSSA